MASRRGQALFHAHGLGQAVRVSREINQQTRGRTRKLASPFGGGGLQQASRRGQALFHAHGLGQAVRVSRETNRQTQGRMEKLASPFGEVACDEQGGEGRHSFTPTA